MNDLIVDLYLPSETLSRTFIDSRLSILIEESDRPPSVRRGGAFDFGSSLYCFSRSDSSSSSCFQEPSTGRLLKT